MELPSDYLSGALACFTAAGSAISKRFAWLSGPGLYRGDLNLGTEEKLLELDYLSEHNLLPLPLVDGFMETPLSVVCTLMCLNVVNFNSSHSHTASQPRGGLKG